MKHQCLHGRSLAIITGSSRGLGFRIAQELCSLEDPSTGHGRFCPAGHDLLLIASSQENLNRAMVELRSQTGFKADVRLYGHVVDLGDLEKLEGLLKQLGKGPDEGGLLPAPAAAYASVLLVHNAAQTGELVLTWQQGLANIRDQMNLNVVSPAALTAAVTAVFIKVPSCREVTVVDISSVSATKPYEAFGKAARLMLVRTLAREADMFHNTAPDGIQGPSPTHQQQHQPQQQPGQPCADNAVEGSLGSSVQGSCVQDPSVQGTCDASGSPGSGSSTAEARAGPYIRTISYSPGPLDTDMQAESRESLPAIPLKTAFTANMQQGKLVDPKDSARRLVKLLCAPRGTVPNGVHTDYYSLLDADNHGGFGAFEFASASASANKASPNVRHPLDR